MDDLEFVQRCVKGDKQARDELVNRYSRLIYSYIYSVFKSSSSSNQEFVSDIFQEIFALLLKNNCKKLSSYGAKNGCTFASWLRQVTVHYTVDFLRRQKPSISLDAQNKDGVSLSQILPDPSESAKESLDEGYKRAQLWDCIKELDNNDKILVEYNIFRRIGLEKLMDIFKISRAALDMRKARILQKLKDCFRRKGFLLDF